MVYVRTKKTQVKTVIIWNVWYVYLQIKGENTFDMYSDFTIQVSPVVNLYKLKLFCVDYNTWRMFSWSEYTTSAQVITIHVLWKMKKNIYFINCYWSLYVISIKEEHFVIIQKEMQIDHVNMKVSIWNCKQNHNWPTKSCLLDIYEDQI